jgi:hypothetical protein
MSLFRREPSPDPLEARLAAIEAAIGVLSEPPPPAPVVTTALLLGENALTEEMLPAAFVEDAQRAFRLAKEAEAQLAAIFHRLNAVEGAVEETLKDPETGLDRVRALEQAFDSLLAQLSQSLGVHLEPRGRPQV